MKLYSAVGETTEYEKKAYLEWRRPKSWCKTVSAFANGKGGSLVFGVDDKNHVLGLENAQKDAEKISELIQNKLDPLPTFSIRIIEEEGKLLIVLDIEEGKETPYYVISDGNRIAYHRIGNQSVPADSLKLRELTLRGARITYDTLSTRFHAMDFAFTKLKATYYQRTGNSFAESDFESFGLIDTEGFLTNAGALLCDEPPLRHSRLFCTRWNGLTKASGVMDALDDSEFTGSLISLLQEGLSFIRKNAKKMWRKNGECREELPDYPEDSIREALVNALIHRDYLELGSEVHIDMYDDRLEIYSPGGMCDGSYIQDLDLDGISSKRRNPVIADVFSRLNYMERRGSGFKKICDHYERQARYDDTKKPKFYSTQHSFLLTLWNLNYALPEKATIKSDDKKVTIKSDDEKRTAKSGVQYDMILQSMEREKLYKLSDITSVLQVKDTRAKNLLKDLIQEGKIEPVGANRNRRYRKRYEASDEK
ncbi:MAG: putative DNA binding domain-containing protein [Firmicutes bacterium]|nr:putative DNA binding domain-containing protein [Bacillota bacterium]